MIRTDRHSDYLVVRLCFLPGEEIHCHFLPRAPSYR